MAHGSDPHFHVLHVVRIRGRVATHRVGEIVGDLTEVELVLTEAMERGHVVHREGAVPGWSLTPEGRSAHAEMLAGKRAAAAVDHLVGASYERFLALNDELIAVCTRWQLRADGSLNDHTDAAYDAAVIDELAMFDGRAQPVCAELAATLRRFGSYGRRLATAVQRVQRGEVEWFTSPAMDSYHTVWFELHEDLLQTLGIPRRA